MGRITQAGFGHCQGNSGNNKDMVPVTSLFNSLSFTDGCPIRDL